MFARSCKHPIAQLTCHKPIFDRVAAVLMSQCGQLRSLIIMCLFTNRIHPISGENVQNKWTILILSTTYEILWIFTLALKLRLPPCFRELVRNYSPNVLNSSIAANPQKNSTTQVQTKSPAVAGPTVTRISEKQHPSSGCGKSDFPEWLQSHPYTIVATSALFLTASDIRRLIAWR